MIVVTTPTGNIGRHVVRHLTEASEPVRVVARDPAKLPHDLRDKVKVVTGSHGDAATVDKAFEGADAVFWLCPPSPASTPAAATVDFARPGAEAIRRHGVRHVVAVTTLGRGTSWQEHAGNATGSIHMVDLLRSTGVAIRGIALPAFMDNALRMVGLLCDGRMPGPIAPHKKLPHTAARDSAAAAAGLLINRNWSGQEDVPVLGPEDLSYFDLAVIISEVTGRDIQYQHQTYEAYKEAAMASGLTDAFAQGFVDMLRAKEEGMDNVASRAKAFIGTTTFRQWVIDELQPAMANYNVANT
ncbi:NAD-dependent epimerase/dehydratase family protein [Sphingomonas ginsenosidivorax]|uniref:NAD-dependent epimerase/dehydratase family protein n=1 Tax=Sphingomonas ginsenosidivorax TaxID=862135 RepID=A0A5C6U830_9SPHN|nr:NAD(P)H-binding protein [Sphingomonas ginsenosidivorax]TXC67986.1 NAD-dependent epimerase/dehydratase family protein [Sphingomonas ginsenosidivorax]